MNHAEAQQSQPTTDISTVECRSEQSSFRSYAAGSEKRICTLSSAVAQLGLIRKINHAMSQQSQLATDIKTGS